MRSAGEDGALKLRPLLPKDAPGMLEWMRDPAVNRFFRFDAAAMDEAKALAYIAAARDAEKNLHLACVDGADAYLGTISLKNIDNDIRTAEYAVSFRAAAQGTGAAAFATRQILRIAFCERGLERVYLDVMEHNARARRFYEKQGFVYEGTLREHIVKDGRRVGLALYGMLKQEWSGANE